MIRIDDSLLEELGLISLPKPERDALLSQIYETLEMRVGMKLAERMTDQQLDEFEAFLPNDKTGSPGDEAGALKWLETNFPDYKQVVAAELEKLKEEIKRDSQQILQSYQASASVNPPQAAQPQPQVNQQMPQQGPPSQSFSQQPPMTPPDYAGQSPYDQNQQPPMAA